MDGRSRELEAEMARLRAETAGLRATVERLTAALEAAQRAGKREAAPFRKADGLTAAPRKPGRKKERRHGQHVHRAVPAPHEIDER
jgi:transposase